MKVVVTGGAGFIGSCIVEKFLDMGNSVIVLDNLDSGKMEFIEKFKETPNFHFNKTDLLNDDIDSYFKDADEVYHFAANPDVKVGNVDSRVHFDQNIVVTYRVLEACRKNNIKKFIFASSSTVYGETDIIPTPEESHLEPISLYGASKLASESLISSYAHNFDIKSYVFRLANVIGGRSTHGIIFDFFNKLKTNPNEMEILGDGTQNKSYMYVDDCIDAILFAIEKSNETIQVFNIGSENQTDVKTIAGIVSEELNLNPEFGFTGGDRGWKGDVPKMMLDISKLKNLGWQPRYNSEEAVRKTIQEIVKL